jgi:aspartate racemase
MKKIGIVGGMAPESTLEFYRQLAVLAQENLSDRAYPTIIIYSVNMAEFRKKLRSGDYPETISFLSNTINSLAAAGADFAVVASNTPHMFFDELVEASSIPLLSMVDETAREAKSHGFNRVGLFGTQFTMEGDFYRKSLEKNGIMLSIPGEEDRKYIDDKTMTELADGKIELGTQEKLVKICRKMVESEGIEALILGSTELSLILNEKVLGLPVLDTTRISIKAVFDYSLT